MGPQMLHSEAEESAFPIGQGGIRRWPQLRPLDRGQKEKTTRYRATFPPRRTTAMKPLTNAHAGAQPCTEQPSVGLEPQVRLLP